MLQNKSELHTIAIDCEIVVEHTQTNEQLKYFLSFKTVSLIK